MRFRITVDFPEHADVKYFHISANTQKGQLHRGTIVAIELTPLLTLHESAMPCGCDPGANHVCHEHADGGVRGL